MNDKELIKLKSEVKSLQIIVGVIIVWLIIQGITIIFLL